MDSSTITGVSSMNCSELRAYKIFIKSALSEGGAHICSFFTDLCSSSSSSVDIIFCRWWDRAFPGMYFKELFSFDSTLSDETQQTIRNLFQIFHSHSFFSKWVNELTVDPRALCGSFVLRVRESTL